MHCKSENHSKRTALHDLKRSRGAAPFYAFGNFVDKAADMQYNEDAKEVMYCLVPESHTI